MLADNMRGVRGWLIGDVAQLKSSGPRMTVYRICDQELSCLVETVWFVDGMVQRDMFDDLELINLTTYDYRPRDDFGVIVETPAKAA